MTDPAADAPSDTDAPQAGDTLADPVVTPAQRLIKALALYIFPAILLGLLVLVIVSVVRNATETRPMQTPAAAAGLANQNAPDPTVSDQTLPEQAAPDQTQVLAQDVTQDMAQALPEASVLSGLSDRLDRLEAAQARSGAAADLVRAAIALERAAQGGASFRAELDAVDAGLAEPRLLLPLRPMADRGVPTLASLTQSFPAAAARAYAAAQRPDTTAGDPLAWLGQWFGSIVSVRRTDMTEGTGTQAILNRADARLKAGDLSGAITELNGLPSKARAALKPWLDRAAERLIVDETTRGITEVALTRLGANRPRTPEGDDL